MPERQALDPALRQFLDEQAASAPDFPSLPDAARTQAHREALLRALNSRDVIAGLPNGVHTRGLTVADHIPARLYTPFGDATGPRPLLIYLHGGGWVAGSLDTVHPFCRLLSAAADLLILSVDYRQPPTHRYPAALQDSVAAVRWAAAHAGELQADPQRVAVGGDSAGGNLAAATLNHLAADPESPRLRALLLLYPVTDHPDAQHPSYEENATGFGLTAESMRWFWKQYAPDADPDESGLSPLRIGTVPPLPPTLIATAEYDVLRDEGTAYVEKLRSAQIPVTHIHAADMHHDFPVSPATVARFPQSVAMLNEVAGWLRATLHTPLPDVLAGPPPTD